MSLFDRFKKWAGVAVDQGEAPSKEKAAGAAEFATFLESEGLSPETLLAQRNELLRRSRTLIGSMDGVATVPFGSKSDELKSALRELDELCEAIVPGSQQLASARIAPPRPWPAPDQAVVDKELAELAEVPGVYDSRIDTAKHIIRVRELLSVVMENLGARGLTHDQSKLRSPEKEIFDEFTPKLKGSTYGSSEYNEFLQAMSKGLEHHYAHNSHHPEHYGFRKCEACGEVYKPDFAEACEKCGCVKLPLSGRVAGMSLLDVAEMFCDWKAATERHADGSLEKSIKLNKKRFGFSDELAEIFENTRKELGW